MYGTVLGTLPLLDWHLNSCHLILHLPVTAFSGKNHLFHVDAGRVIIHTVHRLQPLAEIMESLDFEDGHFFFYLTGSRPPLVFKHPGGGHLTLQRRLKTALQSSQLHKIVQLWSGRAGCQ